MAIAIGELGIANTATIAVGTLDRGWTLYAHKRIRGEPLKKCHTSTPVAEVWESLRKLQDHQISHGDLRNKEITVSHGAVFFGGFGSAEYGATENQLQADIAQLLVTTSALYGADEAVAAAIGVLGRDTVLIASRRLTKTAVPKHIRASVNDAKAVINRSRAAVMRQTGTEKIQPEAVTRFSRSQLVQLLLLGALVYVAYPFISTVPTFFNALGHANWWWALLGLAISASTYVGAAAALWASADESVNFWRLSIAQVANTFAATTTPAGVGGLALSTRILQKSGLSTTRATTAVALQQSMQVIMHIVLLIFFSTAAGAGTDLSHFVPKSTMLYLIAGVALGIIGVALLVPNLRRWLSTAVDPQAQGDRHRHHRSGPRTQADGTDRLGLHRNDSRRGTGVVDQRRGIRRQPDVRQRHRGDDGRRHPRIRRAHPGRRRRRRGGADRWARRLRPARGHQCAVGAALSGADLLDTGIRRLAGDAVVDPQRHGLGRHRTTSEARHKRFREICHAVAAYSRADARST